MHTDEENGMHISGTGSDDSRTKKNGGVPLVFMTEKKIFGDRIPTQSEWLKHEELYESIGSVIEPSHITGLQRVRGMWRIYIETLKDKVALLTHGVTIRGKSIDLMHTNPQRLDGEGTIRIRIKNIPLSVDDTVITHTFIKRELDVINISREMLRVKGRLTNCQTGDRIAIVKSLSLKEPLPHVLSFAQFTGRVIHYGQVKKTRQNDVCGKCLESGHKKAECENEWKCLSCKASGHRKGECQVNDNPSSAPEKSSAIVVTQETNETKGSAKKTCKSKKQTVIDTYVQTTGSVTETPAKGKKSKRSNRSPPTPAEILNDRSKKGKHAAESTESDSDSEN